MTQHLERRLTITVADYLRVAMPPEIIWFHPPNGEHRTEQTGALLKRMGLRRGVPDFLIVLPGGRAGFIELKAPKGRLSDEQIAFAEQVQALGARFGVARSVDDVRAILTDWGVALRARVAA